MMNLINQKLAIEKLNEGLPIVFQTDTLPAIGCLPEFSDVIYRTKKRDKNKPLILMGADYDQLTQYVHKAAQEDYKSISSTYWPGALTIITPISDEKLSSFCINNLTIGLRIPNSSKARSLIRKTGPLLTSSANLSGSKTPLTAKGVSMKLPNVSILGPIPWEKCSGKGSTIISWINDGNWELIREGEISISGIC